MLNPSPTALDVVQVRDPDNEHDGRAGRVLQVTGTPDDPQVVVLLDANPDAGQQSADFAPAQLVRLGRV